MTASLGVGLIGAGWMARSILAIALAAIRSHWITMADPTGRRYCLTMRDPATGKLPSTTAR